MGRWILAILVWSEIAILLLLFVPGNVNTPECAHLVQPTPACLEELRVMNDGIWWTRTVPLLLVAAAGYLVIAIAALRARRRQGAGS